MNKIKLMIKVLIYVNALFFITVYLTPSTKVFADFTDTVSLNTGIKLTLGNLAMSPEKDETITGLTYLGGDPVLLSTHNLKNEGTLDGKLAYKIQITEKGTAIPVNDSETQLLMNFDSVIGDKIIPAAEINSDSYTFVTDNDNNEWIIDGNPKKDIPVTIKYKTTGIPDKDRDIDITVTFLLVQTNSSKPKETMFYDKVSFKHELKLKDADIPSPSDPNYWPAADDKNWKWNGEVKYNDAQFENIMYFSEVESSNRVQNLNDNVLYIELPEGKPKKEDIFRFNTPKGYHIEVKVMENRRFIKLTFSFDLSNEEAKDLLTQPNYYQVDFHYGAQNAYVNFDSNLLPLVPKRILLNTDENSTGSFKTLPIYTTLKQKRLTFKHTDLGDNWNGTNLQYPLVDANISYKNLYAEIVEESTLFDLKLHKADQNDKQNYLLINTSKVAKPADKNKKGKLKIIIVGNDGKRLVIYRDLFITPTTDIQSRMIIHSEANIEVEETQEELKKEAVEEPVDTKEIVEQDETLNDNTSKETTEADDSAKLPEENVEKQEDKPLDETVQESSVSDITVNKDIE